MKKLLLIFMTFAVLLLSGCANTKNPENSTTDKTSAQLTETVMNSVQFPQMIELNDEKRIEEMGIDLSLAQDCSIWQQMLSVDVCEVIIIKASPENMEKVLESLNSRKEALKNYFANYPEQVESAGSTVVGSKKDIAYLICHTEADTAEEKLLAEI